MIFMLFMLFGAFVVVVWRPCCPGNHIDCIIILRPPIHGTLHIILAASSGMAAATTPAAASLSIALLSMTTKPIRFNHCCARGGVFVFLFVVNDGYSKNSFMLRLRRRLWRSLCHRLRRRRYKFNHVGNQHGLPFIGLLHSGDQPQLLSIAWL